MYTVTTLSPRENCTKQRRQEAASGTRGLGHKVLHFNYMGQPKPLCLMYVERKRLYSVATKEDGHFEQRRPIDAGVQSDKLSFNLYPLSGFVRLSSLKLNNRNPPNPIADRDNADRIDWGLNFV